VLLPPSPVTSKAMRVAPYMGMVVPDHARQSAPAATTDWPNREGVDRSEATKCSAVPTLTFGTKRPRTSRRATEAEDEATLIHLLARSGSHHRLFPMSGERWRARVHGGRMPGRTTPTAPTPPSRVRRIALAQRPPCALEARSRRDRAVAHFRDRVGGPVSAVHPTDGVVAPAQGTHRRCGLVCRDLLPRAGDTPR
jgi:hypothetical protein